MKPYVYQGKMLDNNNVLYYGAVPAISRSLRFYAEAKQQTLGLSESHLPVAIFSYYCLFHLAIFMACCLPNFLSEHHLDKFHKFIGKKDLGRALSHRDARSALASFTEFGLDAVVLSTFDRSREIREFVNYGPDTVLNDEEFRVHNNIFSIADCKDVFDNLVHIILASVQWARQYDDIYLVNAIGQAAAFFKDNSDGKPFYAFWSSEVVLNEAEELREAAWKIAMDAHLIRKGG